MFVYILGLMTMLSGFGGDVRMLAVASSYFRYTETLITCCLGGCDFSPSSKVAKEYQASSESKAQEILLWPLHAMCAETLISNINCCSNSNVI